MIKSIQVVNRFRIQLVVNKMYKAPTMPFALISIYSSPEEELATTKNLKVLEELGCVQCLSLLFEDGVLPQDKEWLKYPFQVSQAEQVIAFLDEVNAMDQNIFLIVHCDAGISRSGAVGTFASNYLDIKFQDDIIQPNSYVLSTLNQIIWKQKWNTKD